MRELYNALPDDRPITTLCVVEDLNKCPANFTAVSRTHDQDIDADLYKDGFFKRVTRYICHSKVAGYLGYVVEEIQVVHDKESCPSGYTPISTTMDTNQKAFKKKLICFKAVPKNVAKQVVTDIIVLSSSKIAPEGFTLAGEMNGLCLCYKRTTATSPGSPPGSSAASLPYQVGPHGEGSDRRPSQGSGRLYPGVERPSRPAPAPPVGGGGAAAPLHNPYSSGGAGAADTYEASHSALYQVPFVLNKKYTNTHGAVREPTPSTPYKSAQLVESEYYYSFSLEQDVLQRRTGA